LGAGFKPLINNYIVQLDSKLLYWINMSSAVLDNATLAAAEISPAMNTKQIQSVLIGLLLSGGMLIPGNIPNIIAAQKLNIKSKEWAYTGIPVGLAMLSIFFVILFLI
jgi:predicted cation transporter